jgi:hypothetical protein
MTSIPDGEVFEYGGVDRSTYVDLLKRFGLNPDTVLFISEKNKSIPQEASGREKRVDIVLTCSRG